MKKLFSLYFFPRKCFETCSSIIVHNPFFVCFNYSLKSVIGEIHIFFYRKAILIFFRKYNFCFAVWPHLFPLFC